MPKIELPPSRLPHAARASLDRAGKIALIEELRASFPGKTPNQRIDWDAALAARPALINAIGKAGTPLRNRIQVMASKHFLSQPEQATPLAPAPETPKTNGVGPAHSIYNEEQVAIIRRLSKEFSGSGGRSIRWKAAFEAHPELKPKLGVTDEDSFKRVKNFASRLREKDKKNRRAQTKPRSAEEQSQQAAPVVAGCSFCPDCGGDLRMHNQVAAAKLLNNSNHGA